MLLKTHVVSIMSRPNFVLGTEFGRMPSELTLSHCDPALYHYGPSSSGGWLPAGGHKRRRSGTSLGHLPSLRKTGPHPSRFPLPA